MCCHVIPIGSHLSKPDAGLALPGTSLMIVAKSATVPDIWGVSGRTVASDTGATGGGRDIARGSR
jgi:hypothetical protein